MLVALPVAAERGVRSLIDQNSHPSLPVRSDNLTHSDMHVDLINLEPFVEKMLSAVTKGRFLPRQHSAGDMPIIHCATIGSVQRQLMAK